MQWGRTSLVLLVVDTLRADHVGAGGYPVDTTPVIDGYAERGVRFTRAFTTAAWTRPAMASLLTGLFARTTGVYEEWHDTLPSDLVTLAERLGAQGYVTLGVTANPNVSGFYGFDQGFDAYAEMVDVDPRERIGDMEIAPRVTERALSLVDRHLSELGERPLYLQVLYIDPHLPYRAPDELVEQMSAAGSQHPGYDAEIRRADAEIGRLLDGLARRSLLDDALVVITSDHGEGLDSHPGAWLATMHGHYLYDSVVHVPLALWHPKLPHGRSVDVLASLVDLVPTLLDLLGVPHSDDEIQGRSLAAFILGGAPPWDRPEHVFIETDYRVSRKVAVRSSHHKLVRNEDARLYQQEGAFEGHSLGVPQRGMLSELPFVEVHDVAKGEQPSRPEDGLEDVGRRLNEALEAWEARTRSRPPTNRANWDVVTLRDGIVVPGGGDHREPDAETLEALRALGYLPEPRGPETLGDGIEIHRAEISKKGRPSRRTMRTRSRLRWLRVKEVGSRPSSSASSARSLQGMTPRRHHVCDVKSERTLPVGKGISFLLSVYLWFNGHKDQGLFVGLWVPSILSLGALLAAGRGEGHE